MEQRVRYVGIALPKWFGQTGTVKSEIQQYYLVKFDGEHSGTVAINKQNVEAI